MPTPAASGVRGLNTLRARSYLVRLPLFTRAIVLVIVAFWLAGLQSVWDVQFWGALIPQEINFTTGRDRCPVAESGRG